MGTVTAPDGTTIAYDRSGEGPVLILVGAAFNDRQTTAPLAAVLAPHFTAVSYDRRGRGDSTDTAPYAVEREVEDSRQPHRGARRIPPSHSAVPPVPHWPCWRPQAASPYPAWRLSSPRTASATARDRRQIL